MSERSERGVRWASAGVIVCALLLRVLTTVTRIPGWEQDPTVIWIPDSGISPFGSLVLDALVWVAAGLIALRAKRLCWIGAVGVLAGALGVLLHGFVLTPVVARGGTGLRGDFGSLVLGSAWASAMAGAWALREAARGDGGLRRTVALLLLGAAVPLGAKGLYQVMVEHPQTVESFERSREAWLLANGWEPGSAAARLFERRLRQPEASGWFGLANVYGSVLAACAVAWCVIAVNAAALGRTGAIRPALALGPSLGALLACVALLASGSRGAIGAAGVVLALLVLARFVAPVSAVTRRLAPWMGWLLVGSVLAMVLVRGALGERFGELSVYFRWQYLQGAARIFLSHLPFGVGPDGFKDAYLLAKPPTSPEEVESPHMLPADWLATLGLFGVAWLAVWLGWVRGAGREAFRAPDAAPVGGVPEDGWARPFALVCIAVPVLESLLIERRVSGPDWPFIMAIAGGAWFALVRLTGRVLAAAPERALGIALAGAGLALAMHGMFDVAPVQAHSVGWVMAVIALAAPTGACGKTTAGTPRGVGVALALSCGALAVTLAVWGAIPARRWGASLSESSRLVREFPAPEAGTPVPGLLDRPGVERAIELLDLAGRDQPSEGAASDRAAGLRLRLAQERLARGDGMGARAAADEAVAELVRGAERSPRSSARWARVGAALDAIGAVFADPGATERAARAWERVADLDPHSLSPVVRLVHLSTALGDREGAARWARRALEVDANLRLDPLRRLTDSQRAELERLAGP